MKNALLRFKDKNYSVKIIDWVLEIMKENSITQNDLLKILKENDFKKVDKQKYYTYSNNLGGLIFFDIINQKIVVKYLDMLEIVKKLTVEDNKYIIEIKNSLKQELKRYNSSISEVIDNIIKLKPSKIKELSKNNEGTEIFCQKSSTLIYVSFLDNIIRVIQVHNLNIVDRLELEDKEYIVELSDSIREIIEKKGIDLSLVLKNIARLGKTKIEQLAKDKSNLPLLIDGIDSSVYVSCIENVIRLKLNDMVVDKINLEAKDYRFKISPNWVENPKKEVYISLDVIKDEIKKLGSKKIKEICQQRLKCTLFNQKLEISFTIKSNNNLLKVSDINILELIAFEELNDKRYIFETTKVVKEIISDRGIKTKSIIDSIMKIGKQRLKSLAKDNKNFVVTNEKLNIAIHIKFINNLIEIKDIVDLIKVIELGEEEYIIEISKWAKNTVIKEDLSYKTIVENIVSLGANKLNELKDDNGGIYIYLEQLEASICLHFNENVIKMTSLVDQKNRLDTKQRHKKVKDGDQLVEIIDEVTDKIFGQLKPLEDKNLIEIEKSKKVKDLIKEEVNNLNSDQKKIIADRFNDSFKDIQERIEFMLYFNLAKKINDN